MGGKSWKVNKIKSLDSREAAIRQCSVKWMSLKKYASTLIFAFKYYFLRKHKNFKLGRKMDSCWRKWHL